jgi:LysR family hydrogen peroxide-inducible transcriptional activator
MSARESLEIRDLQNERMLLLREGHCLREDVLTACNRARTPFLNVFESDHLASIFSMVTAGFGISLVPQLAARHCAGCKVLPLKPAVVRRIGYVQAAGHAPLPVQRLFIRFLRQRNWLAE